MAKLQVARLHTRTKVFFKKVNIIIIKSRKNRRGKRGGGKSNDTGEEGSSGTCVEQIYGIIHLSVHIHVSAPSPPLPFIPVVPPSLFLPPPPRYRRLLTYHHHHHHHHNGIMRWGYPKKCCFFKGEKKGEMEIRLLSYPDYNLAPPPPRTEYRG